MYNMCERGRRRRPRSASDQIAFLIFLYFHFFPLLLSSFQCPVINDFKFVIFFFFSRGRQRAKLFLLRQPSSYIMFFEFDYSVTRVCWPINIIIYVCTNRRGRLTSASELEREMTVSSLQFYFSFIYLFCLSILR